MNQYKISGATAELFWHEEIDLTEIDYNRKHELISSLPEAPGVYIFHRRYGDFGEALYVGKTENLRRRISQALNARELIEHIKGAKKGYKLLSVAEIGAHGNFNISQCIDDIESVLIEQAMQRGDSLFNVQKTKRAVKEITSNGHRPVFMEKSLYIDNTKKW